MGGREVEFREEEEVEKCGERSVEAQLVRPPLQPAAASDEPVSSLARLSSLSLSVLPPPPTPLPGSPSVPSPLQTQPSCSMLSTLLPCHHAP